MAAVRGQVFCYAKYWQYLLRIRPNGRQNVVNFGRRHACRTFVVHAPRLALALGIPIVPSVHALWTKKTDGTAIEMSPIEKVIAEADILYTDNNIVDLYSLLKSHREAPVAEVQWRLGRAAYEMSKLTNKPEEKKAFIYEASDSVQKALELDDNSFAAHKWYAILLDIVGELEGTKRRIQNAFLVKEHFMKAIELKPNDATSVHLLGYWCFMFADMPWYQRKVAAVTFASPPSSTYEEALEYFEKAESIEPSFYSKNLTMIGKTYLRLGDKQKAKIFLTRAHEYPVKTEDDKASHKEAEELLKSV